MPPDLNDVLVFAKVVETRSFTAAGKALGLPNSSVSRKVARLEEGLGARLLSRSTRRLSLTEAGRLYYERAVGLLSGLEEAAAVLAEAQSTPRGRVRMLAPPEHSVSIQLVSEFLHRYPEVRVDLTLTTQNVNIIEQGYDLAFVAGPVANQSVVAHKLMDSRFRLVASPTYLKRRGIPESIDALSDHDCIIFGTSSAGTTWALRGSAGEVRVPVRGRLAVNNLTAVRDAVLAHHGIALLPGIGLGEALRTGRMQVVLEGAEPEPVTLWVTYAGTRYLTPAVRALVDHAREHFQEVAQAR